MKKNDVLNENSLQNKNDITHEKSLKSKNDITNSNALQTNKPPINLDLNDLPYIPTSLIQKHNALVVLTYENRTIMKAKESKQDILKIQKEYNTYVVACKDKNSFVDAHKNAARFFKEKTNKKISLFYIHAHGLSDSIALSDESYTYKLWADSLNELDLSQYYEQNNQTKGILNACLTAVEYSSKDLKRTTSFAQEFANSLKAPVEASAAESSAFLNTGLHLVYTPNSIKTNGFIRDHGSFYLPSNGLIFYVKRARIDKSIMGIPDFTDNDFATLVKHVKFKYLIYRIYRNGTLKIRDAVTTIEAIKNTFNADKVYNLRRKKGQDCFLHIKTLQPQIN